MHAGASPEIFRIAAKLRMKMSEPEKKLWAYLKLKPKETKFRRQHPCSTYILDFYCHSKSFSIEIDGENHNTKKQKEKDLERTSHLNKLGIKEIRFTNDEILNNFEAVVDKIESLMTLQG
jgi:very-short-patch-repair endonuclease